MHSITPPALATLLLVVMSGCAATAEPTPSPTAPDAVVYQDVIDELGYFPADTPWSAAEREQSLTDAADTWWSFVVQRFPDAERPAVSVVEEVADGDSEAVLGACLEAAGVNTGEAGPYEYQPSTLDQNLAWYTCKVQFPDTPHPAINAAQLGYLYDYLTKFAATCLEARGSDIEEAPSREAFITEWPNQNWFPSSSASPDSEQNEADNAACSSDIRDFAA